MWREDAPQRHPKAAEGLGRGAQGREEGGPGGGSGDPRDVATVGSGQRAAGSGQGRRPEPGRVARTRPVSSIEKVPFLMGTG